MEIKKTPVADLQNKKKLFLEIGFVFALVCALLAFNWNSQKKEVTMSERKIDAEFEEVDVPITEQKAPEVQDVQQVAQVSENIVIVDNNIELSTDVNFDMSDDKNRGIDKLAVYSKPVAAVAEETVEEKIPFAIVEHKPTFQGGDATAFTKWVNSKVNYPAAAQENNIQGTVYLAFDVGVDGKLVNVKILRGVDPLLDHEALRVVRSSPVWVPGRQQNKSVKVSYQFPVKFQLQ